MRTKSPKTSAIDRKLAPERAAYVAANRCVISGLQATEVHEIEGGSDRQRTKRDIRYWLSVNRMFHQEIQDTPKETQWAIKLLKDPENFDAAAITEIPGKRRDLALVLNEAARMLKERF